MEEEKALGTTEGEAMLHCSVDFEEQNNLLANNWDLIGRIQFRRGVKEHYPPGAMCQFELILCSEFNDSLGTEWMSRCSFSVALLRGSLHSHQCIPVTKKSSGKKNDIFHASFQLPDEYGQYAVRISASMPNKVSQSIFLVPIISEFFAVEVRDLIFYYVPSLLTNYRMLRVGDTTISVKEEYGSTIGSHVYDSALILAKWLSTSSAQNEAMHRRRKIIELGAGSGIAGLCCASLWESGCLLTDQAQQMKLLQTNIDLNRASCPQVDKLELEWSDQAQVHKILEQYGDDIGTILAADVLYDSSIASVFLQLLQQLFVSIGQRTASFPLIYVAQKNRKLQSMVEAQDQWQQLCSDIMLTCVHEEAAVFVWSIQFQPH